MPAWRPGATRRATYSLAYALATCTRICSSPAPLGLAGVVGDAVSGLSKSQVHKLGERLAAKEPTKEDLELLDQYRLSFGPAYEEVTQAITNELGLQLSGRPQKTTESIIAKIRRERTSLPRMQDIAGGRIVVETCSDQDDAARRIRERFPGSRVTDRRVEPSHGYRAVHVIVVVEGKSVEIQVRTRLQDGWAQLSEKLSDMFGIDVKYGGGPEQARDMLSLSSQRIAEVETLEQQVAFGDRDHPAYEEVMGRLATVREELGLRIQTALRDLDGIQRLE